MSSSTFAVTETENEAEKDLNFGLEACEENGIGLTAQVDGEVPKDHTYTKDPDGSEDEGEKTEDSQEERTEVTESLPEKRTTPKRTQKAVKKNNPRAAKAKREASPKKEVPASKRAKTKKDVLTEESNKSDESTKPEKAEEVSKTEDETKPSKRGKKRKMEEKENVIDRSIVEEVQNINEGDTVPDVNTESPAKNKKTDADKTKGKKPSKLKTAAAAAEDGVDNQNLPEGWVRKVVVRKSGKTAGQVDIYIYSPDGIKFRSRPDIAAYLARTKSNLKLEYFNFSKKQVSDESVVKSPVKKEKPTPAVKPKNTPEKKKVPSTPVKKGSKLLVKLNFSPKSKRGKNVKKTSDKQTRQIKSPVKKEKTPVSSSRGSKKKKSA